MRSATIGSIGPCRTLYRRDSMRSSRIEPSHPDSAYAQCEQHADEIAERIPRAFSVHPGATVGCDDAFRRVVHRCHRWFVTLSSYTTHCIAANARGAPASDCARTWPPLHSAHFRTASFESPCVCHFHRYARVLHKLARYLAAGNHVNHPMRDSDQRLRGVVISLGAIA